MPAPKPAQNGASPSARMANLAKVVPPMMAPPPSAARSMARQRRSLRALLGRQNSLMARKVAERHAETGEHYITRNRDEYRAVLALLAGWWGLRDVLARPVVETLRSASE